MSGFASICPECNGAVESTERFCATCANDVLVDIGIDLTQRDLASSDLCASHRPRSTAKLRWGAAGAALALATIVGLGLFDSAAPSTGEGTAALPPTNSLEDDEGLPASISAPQNRGNGAGEAGLQRSETVEPPAGDATFPISTDGLVRHGGEQLAVLQDGMISLIDLGTGEVVGIEITGTGPHASLASADDRLVYIGLANAFMITSKGGEVLDLGVADTAIDGSMASTVWIGELVDDRSDRMNWREIDADGTVLRATVTALPLDFNLPDLRWGHQHRMLRLTDNESRPWRVLAQGFPVAAGPNDIILNSCSTDQRCDRRWFDLRTGTDRGPLLADVADNIGDRSDGQLSPNGRYWLSDNAAADGVTLLALATGEEIENKCTQTSRTRWSRDDELLACTAEDDLLIYNLANDNVFRVDLAGTQALSFTFVQR